MQLCVAHAMYMVDHEPASVMGHHKILQPWWDWAPTPAIPGISATPAQLFVQATLLSQVFLDAPSFTIHISAIVCKPAKGTFHNC